MAATSKAPIDWTTPYLESFRGIERAIRLSRGFVLLPVEAPGPDPGRALGEWLTAQGYPAVIHEPRDDKEWAEIAGTLFETEVPPNGVVMVLGGPVLPKGFYEGVWLLNQKRDPIARKLGRPLLWCGPRELLSAMWERAPDFWSIRAVERRLEATPGAGVERAPAPPRESGPSYDVSLDRDVVTLRRAVTASSPPISLVLGLAHRLARADELAEAEELLDKATTTQILRRSDLIEAWLERASVARRQGRLVSAREYLAQAESIGHPPTYYFPARFRLEHGRIALDEGNLDEARNAIERAREVAKMLVDPSVAVEVELALANLYLETPGPGNAQLALEILDQTQRNEPAGSMTPMHFASEGGHGADADSEVEFLTTRARALAYTGSAIKAEDALSSGARRIRMLPPGGHAAALLVRIARTAIDIGARKIAEDVATDALRMARTAGDIYAERHAAEALDRARQAAK